LTVPQFFFRDWVVPAELLLLLPLTTPLPLPLLPASLALAKLRYFRHAELLPLTTPPPLPASLARRPPQPHTLEPEFATRLMLLLLLLLPLPPLLLLLLLLFLLQ
jgi:hypothetical protein